MEGVQQDFKTDSDIDKNSKRFYKNKWNFSNEIIDGKTEKIKCNIGIEKLKEYYSNVYHDHDNKRKI